MIWFTTHLLNLLRFIRIPRFVLLMLFFKQETIPRVACCDSRAWPRSWHGQFKIPTAEKHHAIKMIRLSLPSSHSYFLLHSPCTLVQTRNKYSKKGTPPSSILIQNTEIQLTTKNESQYLLPLVYKKNWFARSPTQRCVYTRANQMASLVHGFSTT